MKIVDKLKEIIDPTSYRGSAIEYGSAPEALYGNSLFDYEINNWKVICIQKDRDCFDELRIFRRFAYHLECSEGGCLSVDEAIGRINLEDIQILLIKNTDDPISVLEGFSLEKRKTQVVCVQQEDDSESRKELTLHLDRRGFRLHERVLVSDIYIRKIEQADTRLEFSESIFEV